MQGFLNLNKSAGFTSHDCVAKVRRLLHLKRVGHGGTLDPAATGVLPIAVGRATRLLQYLNSDKAYQGTIRLGVTTTTDDLEGEVVATCSTSGLSLESVLPVLQSFQGNIEQVPPRYSAVQVQGKRLYDLARAGQTADIPKRRVQVDQIDLLNWRPGESAELDVAIACGAGTYIRSIARDLGAALHCGGTLAALTRTRSSGFTLDSSLTLEELARQVQAGIFNPISPEAALNHLGRVSLSPDRALRWCQGQRIIYQHELINTAGDICRVHRDDGTFLGITQVIQSECGVLLAPQMVFMLPD